MIKINKGYLSLKRIIFSYKLKEKLEIYIYNNIYNSPIEKFSLNKFALKYNAVLIIGFLEFKSPFGKQSF